MIHQLKNYGLSISGIARRLNLDRKRVRRYLRFKHRLAQPQLRDKFSEQC